MNSDNQPVSLVEIVRLPVAPDRIGPLLAFVDGHAYFAQAELVSSRVLVAEDDTEVALLIEWADRGASARAIESSDGQSLIAGLGSLLSGAPAPTYYRTAL